jgi:hypothetical protein
MRPEAGNLDAGTGDAGARRAGEPGGYYPLPGFFAGANYIHAPMQKIFAIPVIPNTPQQGSHVLSEPEIGY